MRHRCSSQRSLCRSEKGCVIFLFGCLPKGQGVMSCPCLFYTKMNEYVTLEELRQHLNVDFDHDDAYISGLIEPVQLAIEAYLNRPLTELVKDGKIDRRIWHAIRILVANYYANREDITFAAANVIPGHIALLLQPLKKYT